MIGYSLNALYQVVGITRQEVWDHFRREQAELEMIRRVIGQVDKRRASNPGEGLEKMYGKLQPEGMGREHYIQVSMGRKAQDNAFTERINGVIKNEYLIPRELKSFPQLRYYTRQAVTDSNTERHHGALPRCSPNDYEQLYWQQAENERKVQVIRSEKTPTLCL